MVTAIVREWDDEGGWGVLDSPETPGGYFGHYSHIQANGFRALSPGQQVDLTWEAPGFKQDGYNFRAVSIVPPDIHNWHQQRRTPTGSSGPATPRW
ncbi:cold-shock protein [Streptomyces sp. NRRL S-1022]|uniref:cold-shock protein n=1 Tax=Streptomyces sp. NRRL S-1022 TaxID=1463880 RepID=UPI000D143900|nr:cold shock domain-containing protein [Streptomyces sp. NRRL S-1022]